MKMVFIVHNDYYNSRVTRLLETAGIDYYTRWDKAHGKGHGTEPHVGVGSYASTNAVLMIAFKEEGPLERLVEAINASNAETQRPDDRIRLFQLPLERVV